MVSKFSEYNYQTHMGIGIEKKLTFWIPDFLKVLKIHLTSISEGICCIGGVVSGGQFVNLATFFLIVHQMLDVSGNFI